MTTLSDRAALKEAAEKAKALRLALADLKNASGLGYRVHDALDLLIPEYEALLAERDALEAANERLGRLGRAVESERDGLVDHAAALAAERDALAGERDAWAERVNYAAGGIAEALTFNKLDPDMASWQPGDIIDKLASEIERAEARAREAEAKVEALGKGLKPALIIALRSAMKVGVETFSMGNPAREERQAKAAERLADALLPPPDKGEGR